ncbi:hypothetical protein [Haloferula sp. BvORR071]|uniref:hypothetical protein n=1 Tax=Haloferula sp. BvORR071 TaxID=1396141 RepID=UPI00055353E9|nr:hypothetical protein [Haloferula sp. BvORR071]
MQFRTVALALALWLAILLLITASGTMAGLLPPWPQLILAALVLLLLAVYAISKSLRDWLHSIPLASLIALHLVRFVGIYFLWLHARGELPGDFAIPAGWGDIAVATFALLLLITRHASRRTYLAWNFLGLVDILFVVITAARLAIANPASMATLLKLPSSLLPTFIVPLVIFTHIVIFVRLLGVHSPARTKGNARSSRQPERAHLPP